MKVIDVGDLDKVPSIMSAWRREIAERLLPGTLVMIEPIEKSSNRFPQKDWVGLFAEPGFPRDVKGIHDHTEIHKILTEKFKHKTFNKSMHLVVGNVDYRLGGGLEWDTAPYVCLRQLGSSNFGWTRCLERLKIV